MRQQKCRNDGNMLHSYTFVVIAPGLRMPEVSLLRSMYHGLTDRDTLFAPCITRTVCMSDRLQHGLHHLCRTVARHVPSICRVVVVLHISWCHSQRHRASSMHHAVIDVVMFCDGDHSIRNLSLQSLDGFETPRGLQISLSASSKTP